MPRSVPKPLQSLLLPVQQAVRDVLAVLYPQSCQACGAYLLETERELCTGCLARLPYTGQAAHLYRNALINRLPGHWAGAAALCHYEGFVQDLVHLAKYHEAPFVAHRLGQELGRQLAASVTLPSETVLVPVPLHPRKLRQRGYNQAEWIAKGLASAGPWHLDSRLVVRTRHTSSQTGLDREARQANVADVFAVRGQAPRVVAVVDDVITTGATVVALAQALQAAGVQDVYALSLAEVDA